MPVKGKYRAALLRTRIFRRIEGILRASERAQPLEQQEGGPSVLSHLRLDNGQRLCLSAQRGGGAAELLSRIRRDSTVERQARIAWTCCFPFFCSPPTLAALAAFDGLPASNQLTFESDIS